MHPLETYLKSIGEIRATGGATPETSYYGAFETLLNDVGSKLKPKVRAVPQLKNTGGGQPDYGLYAANQFQRAKDSRPIEGLKPERGAIEAKSWTDDSFVTAKGGQVSKYWDEYGLVLVTNYRDFVLVGKDASGKAKRLETYRLADTEQDFIALVAKPRKTAEEQGDRFIEFLRRVMLYEAALTDPQELAWFLASYAREARYRIEAARELPALDALKNALEEALGMTFEGEKGDHFFRATLVQTLFYGIFSSWVLWCRESGFDQKTRFDWHTASWTLHVPMVAGLFSQISTPQRLKPLGIDEVLNWAADALNRVDRSSFFSKFEEEYAVQYFYEPFLKAYDPELRKELGVWYTPPEIVQYQVERVDRVLRSELDIADGLADENVVILDPCCGTGAYLVETLKRIHKTLNEKGGGALVAQKLKSAAIKRIFGFEILPAPFVVAHLQLGLMLRQLGAPFDHEDKDQRAGVYLTNALTGWEPLEDPKDLLPFPELLAERDAACKVKQDSPIIVILGNPPYNAFAGTSPEEEGGLVDAYKEGLSTPVKQGGWGIKKYNLDDLYVRFFRIAERRIAKSGKGVVSYISNYSWSSEPSFVVLRERLLHGFDKFWIENMHGNRKISEYAPDGKTSETVFAIPGFSSGIQQGVVISLWVKKEGKQRTSEETAEVLYRDDINNARAVDRRWQLLHSLQIEHIDSKYKISDPTRQNKYSFKPSSVSSQYLAWPTISDMSRVSPFNGLMEKRGGSLIEYDRETLLERMKHYFDSSLAWAQVLPLIGKLSQEAARFDPEKCRTKVQASETFDEHNLRRYLCRPFDTRWCYYSRTRPLWNEPRPAYAAQCWHGNSFLISRPAGVASPEGYPISFTRIMGDNDFQRGHGYFHPILLKVADTEVDRASTQLGLFAEESEIVHNYSEAMVEYLQDIVADCNLSSENSQSLIFMHVLAIGYSPKYIEENADGIRQDWPRIPLPASIDTLQASAELGRRVAELLDTENAATGVSTGKINDALKKLATVQRRDGGVLDPDKGELDITVGWGKKGARGICMPGRGKFSSHAAPAEQEAILGSTNLNIYLNEVGYWANVPQAVWDFTIGGYQVIKKWLSYREKAILGRGLTIEEAEYVTEMVRRIAALILLQPELDANYERVKSDVWPWPRNED